MPIIQALVPQSDNHQQLHEEPSYEYLVLALDIIWLLDGQSDMACNFL
jgi:hypothetical protein